MARLSTIFLALILFAALSLLVLTQFITVLNPWPGDPPVDRNRSNPSPGKENFNAHDLQGLNHSNPWIRLPGDWRDDRDKYFSANSRDYFHSSGTGYFVPAVEWRDSDGEIIQAHGGSILYVPERATFYWYGENKAGPTYVRSGGYARVDVIGVSCYSSKDLLVWKNEGIVLKADKRNSSSDLYNKNVLERPKVIYNDKTRQYVMWMHIDDADYKKASLGVAVSSRPEGPFEYLGSQRHHNFESRDMTLFKDEDGTAYIVYSSETNTEIHITPLQDDYLSFRNTGNDMSRQFVGDSREAPAVFKCNGVYYMITSGCSGWEANQALYHAAKHMMAEWDTIDNPCFDENEEFCSRTFLSQGTFVLPLPGFPNVFIFMADRWNSTDLSNSRYVWLPLTVGGFINQPSSQQFEFPMYERIDILWYPWWKLPVKAP